jgi:hypothetical protein
MSNPMTRHRFVDALAQVALEEVVRGEISTLRQPPGRRPSPALIARSEWFLGLDEECQSLVIDTMRAAAFGTLHRVLVVLDGGASLDDAGSNGHLQLLWRDSDDVSDLTDPTGTPELHDLLAATQGR